MSAPAAEVGVEVPPDAAAVARRYYRVERLASGGLALLVAGAFAAAFLLLRPLPALALGAAIVVLLRAPVFRTEGTARLTTDRSPVEARADFEGPTPPPLALQWGVADDVRPTGDGAVYGIGYLLGLRSVRMGIERRPSASADRDAEIVVTADGEPWATYAVSVRERDGGAEVGVAWSADRRFGLRRLPQWLVAERYREAALVAQGYAVAERDASLSPSPSLGR